MPARHVGGQWGKGPEPASAGRRGDERKSASLPHTALCLGPLPISWVPQDKMCKARAGRAGKVTKLAKGGGAVEPRLNIGSMCTGARIMAVKNDLAKVQPDPKDQKT